MKRILLTQICLVSFIILVHAQETVIHYLSGTDKDHTVNWEFMCSGGRKSGVWSTIPVPSCWELQGFGSYHYGWEENFKENETGFYRFRFQTDPAWKNKRVRIVFEGSMTDTEVKINGKAAGPVHQGSFYRFKYDITNQLKPQNLLEVKVNKISADTSVNRAERMADFWVFGGIFRPVYLEILPKQFIDWIAIDARADGSFLMNVYPLHLSDATTVEAQIVSLDGKFAGDLFSVPVDKKREQVTLRTMINKPTLWNPESPYLYKVVVRLKNKNGVIHTVSEKFGFRTVEFKEGRGFFVNGQKVVFKGVNRHSFWPSTGRTTSKEISILDVNLMKDMNMNAVRMSHYPPDTHFLDVCDSLGLFVLDELGGWQKKYDTSVGRKLLREMIMKDVNHASIVIWDNGNEGGNNHDLVDDFARLDPQQRKVIHPWNVFRGTDTQHYKGYDCCAGSLYHGDLVFFPTEFLHGLGDGGHGAGLNDHWKLMKENPRAAGGFLWAFADEGIVRHDQDSTIDVKGDRAPDGIVGPYREKEGSFYTIKEIWSPVQFIDQNFTNFDGVLHVENNFLYTNLNEVDFKWQLLEVPGAGNSQRQLKVIASGNMRGPDVLPGNKGLIRLPADHDLKNADVLYVTAFDRYGREIFTWSWPLKRVADLNKDSSDTETSKVLIDDAEKTLTVTASGVSISFDKTTGLIAQVKNQSAPISFSGGPVLVSGTSAFRSMKHFADSNDYIVEVNYSGNLTRVKYTMKANGILKLEYSYALYKWATENAFDFLGVTFNYPENKVTGVRYLGYGPYRVWKNRMRGGKLGLWEKKYNNTITGESWDYPEFKGYYRDMVWVEIQNTEHPFTIATDTDHLFLRLFTPDKPRGTKIEFVSPTFPSGDISFLHGINAIGTKFDSAANHGPESQKNKVGTEWLSATLYFDFRVR